MARRAKKPNLSGQSSQQKRSGQMNQQSDTKRRIKFLWKKTRRVKFQYVLTRTVKQVTCSYPNQLQLEDCARTKPANPPRCYKKHSDPKRRQKMLYKAQHNQSVNQEDTTLDGTSEKLSPRSLRSQVPPKYRSTSTEKKKKYKYVC